MLDSLPNITTTVSSDLQIVKLAREIAIDHYEIEEILARHSIDEWEWDKIRQNPRFIQILQAEIEAWHGALNTNERTKLKSAAMLEEYLPEVYGRLHDRQESLSAKVELLKTVARLAGFGISGAQVDADGASKFSVTINLGSAVKQFEKIIDHKVTSEVINDSN